MRKKISALLIAAIVCVVSINAYKAYMGNIYREGFIDSVYATLDHIYVRAGGASEEYDLEFNRSHIIEATLFLNDISMEFASYKGYAERLNTGSRLERHVQPSFSTIIDHLSTYVVYEDISKLIAESQFLGKEAFKANVRLSKVEGLTEEEYWKARYESGPNLKLSISEINAIFDEFFEKFNSDGSVKEEYLREYL